MKKMRLLLVLTTILLSSRFVMAQVSLDLNGDYSTDPLDFAAVADAILAGEQSGSADINQDKKVDVKDITTMYNRIYNTRYFWFGNPRPTASDYTTKSGLAINKYNSISEVLAAAPTIKLDANQNGFILVPSGWDVSDVAMQDTGTGEYYTLTERDTKIVNHKVYYSSGNFSSAGNVTLKKKSDAEAFYKEKHPNNNNDNNNNRYFWFGNTRPTASDYTTKSGLAINKYNSISEVLVDPNIKFDASQDGYSQDGQNGFLLVPSSWDVSDVAMQDTGTGDYYTLKVRDDRNIVNHTVYYSSGKFSSAANVTLKKKSDAEAFYKEKNPNPNNNNDNNDNNNNNNNNDNNNIDTGNVSASTAISYVTNGTPDAVTFNLINKTGYDVYFSGKFSVFIKSGNSLNAWKSDGMPASDVVELECHLSGITSAEGGYSHWWSNPHHLKNGESKSFKMTSFLSYTRGQAKSISLDTYCNGNWYLVSTNNQNWVATDGYGGIPAIRFFTATQGQGQANPGNNQFIFNVSPVKANDAQLLKGKTYNLIIYKAHVDKPIWNDVLRN